MTFFNVYMDESLAVATVQIGFWAAVARLAAVPAALIGPSLSRRIGFGATGASASLLAVLGMLPLALIPSPAAAGIGFTVMLAGTSLRYPAFYVYMMERTPERLRSAMNGANEMAAGLSFSLMSFIGGIIIVDYGYSAAFLAGAFLSLLGTLLFAFYVRKRGELDRL
ncbi:MAG: MFS transporter [Anaerolineales bacterium]|nr:MFS transporter [Anaerolineales bacterium]